MSYLHVDPAKVRDPARRCGVLPGRAAYCGFRYIRTAITRQFPLQQADFPVHTYWEILNKSNDYFVDKKPGALPPPDITGKIVFVDRR